MLLFVERFAARWVVADPVQDASVNDCVLYPPHVLSAILTLLSTTELSTGT